MSAQLLLFRDIGVLLDAQAMRQNYRQNMAQLMTKRYGQSPAVWLSADEQIVADWANYHADLNFSGDEGIVDIHEGLFRVTRALFRIANIPAPPKPEITALAQDLISMPYQTIIFPYALSVLEKCQQAGYRLAIFSYFLQKQAQALCADIDGIEHIIGADTLNHYEHDRHYFAKVSAYLGLSPDTITVIVHSPQTHASAIQSGMNAFLVQQSSAVLYQTLTHLWEN